MAGSGSTFEASIERLADDLAWPEGPTPLPDGTVAFVESDRGRVTAWSPERGLRTVAITGGRPNGSVLGRDGCLYVAQSGARPPSADTPDAVPGIQRVAPDGTVQTVAEGRPLCAPNDIVVGADGQLFFTDPGRWDPAERPDRGAIYALDETGAVRRLLDVGHSYPNGLGFDPAGRLVWVESYTRRVMALRPDGRVEPVHTFEDPRCVPDGLCLLPSGHLVVALTSAGTLAVLPPAGAPFTIGVGSVPTNCALAGDWLYVTDGGAARATGDTQGGGSLWRLRSAACVR